MYQRRAILVWLALMTIEVGHGILRGLLVTPVIGDLPARRLGVLLGILINFGVTCVFIRWIRAETTGQLLRVGILWVALTIVFEVGLGLALGASWQRIAEDYDLLRGGLMPIGLAALAASPWLAHRLRRSPHGHQRS